MTKQIQQRLRIFIACEGESEQSLIKWLQQLANQQALYVHLDCQVLGGGGYKTMLERAASVCKRKKQSKTKAKFSILLVDGDRAERDDGWSLSELKRQAAKKNIHVCVQDPNLEGLLCRMLSKSERSYSSNTEIQKQLDRKWPDYIKPADARTLSQKFSLVDLRRVAKKDNEIKSLLAMIGLFD